MKCSFSTLGAPNWTTEQTAEALAAAGYQGVELRVVDGEIIDPALLDRGARQRLRRAYHARGLDIVAVDSSCKVAQGNLEVRLSMERSLLAHLELAADLDAPLVRVFGGEVPAGSDLQIAVLQAAESLNRVARRAEELGVGVALETHDDFAAARTVMQALALVSSPAVGVLWDSHHPYRMGESVAEVWDLVHERLLHVHVKDARRKEDGSWQLLLLGEGEVPVREMIGILKTGEYQGYISVEWEKKWHPHLPEPEMAVPHHIEILRRYW